MSYRRNRQLPTLNSQRMPRSNWVKFALNSWLLRFPLNCFEPSGLVVGSWALGVLPSLNHDDEVAEIVSEVIVVDCEIQTAGPIRGNRLTRANHHR